MVSLEFKIDPESPDAVYTQLKEQLRSAVDSGPLSDATKLPPIRSLATATGVSVGTMERVVGGMIADGICFRRPRIGVYIKEGSPDKAAASSLCHRGVPVQAE